MSLPSDFLDIDIIDTFQKLEACDEEFFYKLDENALSTCEKIIEYRYTNKGKAEVTSEARALIEEKIKVFKKSSDASDAPLAIDARAKAVFNKLHFPLENLPPDLRMMIYGSLDTRERGITARTSQQSNKDIKNLIDFRKQFILEAAKSNVDLQYFSKLVSAYLEIGDIKGAILLTDTCKNQSKKFNEKVVIINKLISKGDLEEADKIAQPYYKFAGRIDEEDNFDYLEGIIEAYARKGDVEAVISRDTPLSDILGSFSKYIAIAHATNKNVVAAQEEIEKISNSELKIEAYREAAKILSDKKDKNAKPFLDRALEIALSERLINSLPEIGVAQAKLGDDTRAKATFNTAKIWAKQEDVLVENDLEINEFAEVVSRAEAQCGFFEDAIKTASLAKNIQFRNILLEDIIGLLTDAELFDDAIKVLDLIDGKDRNRAIGIIATGLALKDRIVEAENLLRMVQEYEGISIEALFIIYQKKLKLEDTVGAQETYDKAFKEIAALKDPTSKIYLTYKLAKRLSDLRDYERAKELAVHLSPIFQAKLLMYISNLQANDSDFTDSQKSFDEAMKIAQQPPNPVFKLIEMITL